MNRLVLLVVVLFAVAFSNLSAAPAAPIESQVSQPDGTTFTVRARGDEYSNWVETAEGHTVIKVDNSWYYAKTDGRKGIKASNNLVGSLNATQLQKLPLHLAPARNPAALEPDKIRKIQRPDVGMISGRSETTGTQGLIPRGAVSHDQYVVTILVDYSDGLITDNDESFQTLIYGVDNSVKDFFLENSYGGLTIKAAAETSGTADDGIIRVIRSVNHPNQANNLLASATEAREIVQLAHEYIDYASFDTDGNGVISADELAIVIITAGFETSYSGVDVSPMPNVWAHKNVFDNLLLDGKTLSPYIMLGESHADANESHQATIGIICHELGHLILGLPDLYDKKDIGTSEGIGAWGLMGGGSWNRVSGQLGTSPAHLSAWSKVVTNLTVPQDIDSNQDAISFAPAQSSADAKRIWADKYRAREYFLVENRQKIGYDAGLPGEGLLIWHIDEWQDSNKDEKHKWVDLEEADGLAHLDTMINQGDGGDPFPGTSNNTTFNNTSNPNSKNYADADTGIAVTSISASGATMTANFTSATGGIGDHVRYDENDLATSKGLPTPTAWIAIRAQNDTHYPVLDGVDIFIFDPLGATVSIYYYDSMVGGFPEDLIHSQTDIAAGASWNRLLLNTPQPFPVGSERGIVVQIVNSSEIDQTIVFDAARVGSGRSYYSSDGVGAFTPLCDHDYGCGDVNLVALLSEPAAALEEIYRDGFESINP